MYPIVKATAWIIGSTVKYQVCAHCQCEYVYLHTESTEAHAAGFLLSGLMNEQQRAKSKASKEIDAKLARTVSVAPCPSCGHIDPAMAARDKRKIYKTLEKLGQYVLLAGFVVLMIVLNVGEHTEFSRAISSKPLWLRLLIASSIMGIGLSMIAFKYIYGCYYDPNKSMTDVERMQLSRKTVMKKLDYENQLAEGALPEHWNFDKMSGMM